jgi:hypothetical protein
LISGPVQGRKNEERGLESTDEMCSCGSRDEIIRGYCVDCIKDMKN